MFNREIYVQRRDRLSSRFEEGLLLFIGNDESPMNYVDNAYPFRQDSTFLYYFGLDQPGLAALVDVEAGTTTVFGDELGIDDIVWTGELPTVAERAQAAGIGATRARGDLEDAVSTALRADRSVRFLPPYRAATAVELSRLLGFAPSEAEARASVELIRAVVDQRSYKAPEEIAEIEKAVEVSVTMHETAIRMARPGMVEREIAAEVERIALASGGRSAYPVIATINGQTLHNHHHHNTLAEGDVFILDAGAETPLGYAADLTSTFPVSPAFDARQRLVYEVVMKAYGASIDALAPGVPNRDVHFAACRTIFEGMKDLGIMRGDTDEALAAGAHAMVMPHGIGHMMGMDVHDMENLGEKWVGYAGEERSTQFGLKSLRLVRPLEPGFVITVEPGVYFIPQLIDLWRARGHLTEYIDYDELDRWRDLGGYRNEEDFLITEEGARRLGPPKPGSLEVLEKLRAEGPST